MSASSFVRRVFARQSEQALRRLSALPFRYRRRGLQLLFSRATRPLLGRPAAGLVRSASNALGLSRRDSERFLYDSLLHDSLFHMEWLSLGRRSKLGLVADSNNITSDAHDDLVWLAAQGGALIGTMHFGPYSLGLVWLLHRYFQGRRVVIVKSATDDPDERRAIARLAELGAMVEFVSPDRPDSFHQLIKLVRGGAVGIIMVDLPPAYGRSTPFDLLGRRMSFASGTVDLAALCGVPLLLFRMCSDIMADRLVLSDIFEVGRSPTSRERGVARVGRFITNALIEHPDHWHMWGRFGEYRVQEGVA